MNVRLDIALARNERALIRCAIALGDLPAELLRSFEHLGMGSRNPNFGNWIPYPLTLPKDRSLKPASAQARIYLQSLLDDPNARDGRGLSNYYLERIENLLSIRRRIQIQCARAYERACRTEDRFTWGP